MSDPNIAATIGQDIQELDDGDFLDLVKAELDRRTDEDYFNLKDRNNYNSYERMLLAMFMLMEHYD